MSSLRLLLADDHEVVRTGLRAIFESEPGFTVVGEASDGAEAVQLALAHRPSLVLMDVRMANVDGIEACRQIRDALPDVAVLILTSFATEDAVFSALVAGAQGFLLKNAGRAELLRAVRLVADGQSLLDPAVTRRVTQKLVELSATHEPPELAQLSPREREVLALLAKGATNRQIAEALVISEATARNHVSHILEKMSMSRRSEAAAFAARLGLTRDDNPAG